MKKILYFLICLMLSGCVQGDDQLPLTKKARISKGFLENKGYVVLSYEGEETKTYTKSDLTKLPSKQDWAVQTIEPDPYLNKEIHLVRFFVKGHPLDDEFQEGKTSVTVMMWNEEVIGGTSYPYSKHNDLIGGSYSLDGKPVKKSKVNRYLKTELIKMKYNFLEHELKRLNEVGLIECEIISTLIGLSGGFSTLTPLANTSIISEVIYERNVYHLLKVMSLRDRYIPGC